LVGFYNREFAEEEVVYSSFAYQVEIFRIIGDVMAALDESNAASRGGVAPIFEDQSATNQKVATADTKLANWDVQLPQLKRQPIRRDGQVDSLMLTAHLMRNW
jgi:nicotinate-nucleotide pyrophosphorylase (carboxylating)